MKFKAPTPVGGIASSFIPLPSAHERMGVMLVSYHNKRPGKILHWK